MAVDFKPTHKGFLFGVPVYIADLDSEAPQIGARWSCIEWVLDLMESLFGCYCFVMCSINPEFEPMYPIKVTGEIENG